MCSQHTLAFSLDGRDSVRSNISFDFEAKGLGPMKTTDFFTKEDAHQAWYVVDAQDQVLGRLGTRVASGLRGEHKHTFSPHAHTAESLPRPAPSPQGKAAEAAVRERTGEDVRIWHRRGSPQRASEKPPSRG